jgi:hypothetical protein
MAPVSRGFIDDLGRRSSGLREKSERLRRRAAKCLHASAQLRHGAAAEINEALTLMEIFRDRRASRP